MGMRGYGWCHFYLSLGSNKDQAPVFKACLPGCLLPSSPVGDHQRRWSGQANIRITWTLPGSQVNSGKRRTKVTFPRIGSKLGWSCTIKGLLLFVKQLQINGGKSDKAIYFACYSKAKERFNGIFVPNSNIVHICSAGSAAFVTNTMMNPIWMVKTRMQLERKVGGSKPMNALQCARYVYRTEGIRGFYRGLTASYAGISETIICFAIYESLKKRLKNAQLPPSANGTERSSTNFFGLMFAAAVSKGSASCIAYPHEVIRTRLREEGTKYKTFFQTARLVAREEGYLAFYRGLFAQLIRQIPNTAIVLFTYELIVYLLEDRDE
ncbi:solute carrier family 25 member 33 isoform X3 [Alligator sinensis]|uniref:Solute carrier family 25 member 33 isoform X3 n=1 Tax=Alligator sinensis TaxID=38654 RepID=A0A3Q0H8W4_ALLSI|nr:solute carrier family 25 member 33 isoform X3 [Alligator sinensis]